jgi:hypothetical protein
LKLWEHLLANSTLPLREPTATTITTQLCWLLLLDEKVSDRKFNQYAEIKFLASRVVAQLVIVMAREKTDKEEELDAWMQVTAESVMKELSQFGPGSADFEEEDDTEAWISHSLIIRLFPSKDKDGRVDRALNMFRILLAREAIKKMLALQDLDAYAQSLLEAGDEEEKWLCEQSQVALSWRTFAVAYAAFKFLVDNKNDMVENSILCYAICSCSSILFISGWNAFSVEVQRHENREYGIKESAKNALHCLQMFSAILNDVTRDFGKYQTQSHIRRSDYEISVLKRYVALAADIAAAQAGEKRKMVQKDVSQYFKSECGSP